MRIMMDFRQQGQLQGFPGFPGGGFPGGGFPGGGFPGGGFPGGGFPGGGGNVDRRLDQLERQLQRTDRRLDQLERRVDRIERRLGIGSGRPEFDYGTYY